MATGTRFESEELGFFSPTMRPVDSLSAGEVGFLITAAVYLTWHLVAGTGREKTLAVTA